MSVYTKNVQCSIESLDKIVFKINQEIKQKKSSKIGYERRQINHMQFLSKTKFPKTSLITISNFQIYET